MDERAIGVFDSGLGGLTVVRQIADLLPHENIVYFGDTGRVPYGTRSARIIEKYAVEDEQFLLTRNVKLIVAACGTVSSVAAYTGDMLPVPFLGVVEPAARAAANATKNGRVGVIGTGATIQSGAFRFAVERYLPGARVFSAACPLLVPLVESGWIGPDDPVTAETVRRYLEPLANQGIDTLILGCTHYPVLSEQIAATVGRNVTLVHPGEWVARLVRDTLSELGAAADRESPGICTFYVTDRTDAFSETASVLLGRDIGDAVQKIDLKDYVDYA